jgi:hypothetical protein
VLPGDAGCFALGWFDPSGLRNRAVCHRKIPKNLRIFLIASTTAADLILYAGTVAPRSLRVPTNQLWMGSKDSTSVGSVNKGRLKTCWASPRQADALYGRASHRSASIGVALVRRFGGGNHQRMLCAPSYSAERVPELRIRETLKSHLAATGCTM